MLGFYRLIARIVAFAIAACGLFACASAPEPVQAEYPVLVGRFADESALNLLVAEEAFVGESNFLVRFRRGTQFFNLSGAWADRIQVVATPDDQKYAGPYILPLKYQRTGSRDEQRDDYTPVRILDTEDWHALLSRFLTVTLPHEERTGVVLHFSIDDYFLYYDPDGEFKISVIEDKPGQYAIADRIAFSEFIRRGIPLLKRFFSEKGITDRRVAFNTGDTGNYSLPLLYFDLDKALAVFVQRPGTYPPSSTVGGSSPLVQTAGHVAGSHTLGLLFRPVSSIYRLLIVTTNTVAETITPQILGTLDGTPIPPLAQGPTMDLVAWDKELDRLTGRPSSQGTIEYLLDGEEFFTRFIDAVTAATSSISLRTYIFDNDDYAARIGELLKRRSNDHINVKVLLDGLGTIISTMETQSTLPEGYSGPGSVRRFLRKDSRVKVRHASNPWLTGDHVKTAIIDKKIAFTGGMNIAREYRYDWHDLMIELRGPIVDVLQHEFEKTWGHAGVLGDITYLVRHFGPKPNHAEDIVYPIRVLFTRTDRAEIFHAQRQAIRNAQSYIYVQNAYFTDDAMLYELAKARRRGVDVRVIMPLVTDRGPITRNNALAANAMLEHGIRVFVYPGMSHVKAAVFDGWACLGSANWDRWSFRINKELNIATSHAEAVDALEQRIFRGDFDKSIELTEPFPERWSDYLLEFIGDYVF